MERKLYDAITRRSALLDEAKDLLDKGNMEGYKAKMADATAMNEEIEAMQALAAGPLRRRRQGHEGAARRSQSQKGRGC